MATRKRKSEYVDTCLNCGYMLVREEGRVIHGDYGQTWQRCSDRPADAEALEFNGEGEHRRA